MTAKGIKPKCKFQQVFLSTYLFGSFSPITGNSFLLELPYCSGNTFQIYLNLFSKQKPEELKVIVLDNGAFHKTKSLIVPENITLIFLPPYSPELNPAEKIWQQFKRKFTNQFFKTLQEMEKFVSVLSNSLTKNNIKSICSYSYIFSNHFWTDI